MKAPDPRWIIGRTIVGYSNNPGYGIFPLFSPPPTKKEGA